ncbi:hypothetical protein EGW08_021659 [Elysia chlorotica]|uniref:Ig-like domain-containing protein n=1 Tax=Elysia chlorotica TaxID=188477 RepID=A0A3S1B2V7_ELYCH|nr:hypothetical protein EGW08_021659 [Elysia chlorotica]
MAASLSSRLVIVFAVALRTTCAIQSILRLTYSNTTFPALEGSAAFFDCRWSFDESKEYPTQLMFSSPGGQIFSMIVGSRFQFETTKGDAFDATRMQTSSVNANSENVVFTLSRLQCSDEGTYTCIIKSDLLVGGTIQQQADVQSEAIVTLKVPPSAPRISSTPVNLTQGVLENEVVTFVCTANVGSIGKGRVHWRIYRKDVPENILSTDSRISSQIIQPVQKPCTDLVTSTLTLKMTRSDQSLVATCFVSNDDFAPASTLPLACEDTILCDQTATVRIFYPVSESSLTVTHDPQDIYHGGSVTLTCKADGFPEPNIEWFKGNETLAGEKTGVGIRRLVLKNLTVDGDSGEYICVASNNPRGSVASANKSINISVSSTPPPPTDPPTTSTATTTTSGNNNSDKVTDGGGDDDTVIIIVVVIVVFVVICAVIVGVVLYRRKNAKKDVEDQSRKQPNNASNNLAFVNVQPDLVADEKYRTPSLNNSFDAKNEDGLMYADLTYDNRPRSRKPLALGDNASDYSDIQMPHV